MALAISFEVLSFLALSDVVVFSVLLAAIALAGFLGGLLSGVIAAGLVASYAAYFYLVAGREDMPLEHFLVVSFAAVAVAVSAGLLRKWSVLYHVERDRRLQADSERDELRSLVDSVDAIVWEAETEPLRFTYVSKRAERILGYPVEHWYEDSFSWADHIHPEDRELVVSARQEAIVEAKDHELTYRMVRSDGGDVWLSDRAEVSPRGSRTAIRLRGRMVDVTRLKEAERRLAAVHAAAQALMEVNSLEEAGPRILEAICSNLGWEMGALWIVDERDKHMRCVAVWHTEGKEKEEFIAETLRLRLERGLGLPGRVWQSKRPLWIRDAETDSDFSRAALAGKANLHGAFAIPVRSAFEFLGVVEFFSKEIEQPDNELMQLMDSVGIEIGQRIIRLRTEQAVHESEARKAAILESALDCIITADHDGRIIEFNPAAEKTFGWARDDIIGKKIEDTLVPPSLRDEHREGLRRYRETGVSKLAGKRLELPALRSDGTEILVEIALTPVKTDGSEFPLFTGYLRDITEQRRLQQVRMFLAEASTILASSLDYKTTLSNIMKLATPFLCDYCLVDAMEEGQLPRRLASAHGDDLQMDSMAALDSYLQRPGQDHPIIRTLRSGKSTVLSEIDDDILTQMTDETGNLEALRELKLDSMIVVPLQARGRVLGAASFFSSGSGRRYNQEDLQLAEELGRRVSLALDNALRYEERSKIARTLQESLLPRRLPEIPGFEKIGARYRAAGGIEEATEVGGDFYDLFPYGQTRWGIVIGDVSGKGATAAALTSFVRSTVYAEAMQEREPRRMLSTLNEAVIERSAQDQFCTVAYTRLEPTAAGAHLTVVCAGHPQPIVIRKDGTIERIGSPGTMLGLFEEISLEEQHLTLEPGDVVVYYTDGVIEARSPEGVEIFGEDRLEACLAGCAGKSADTIAAAIEKEAVKFSDGRPRDDIAILVLKAK